jgi:energy-coupling factor transporter ATP-binding protein EcfA2
MTINPRYVRVFLSSPADVEDERAIALNTIRALPTEAAYRGRVVLIPVAWDDPGSRTPMLATLTPQEAISQRLAKPSECDIVVVIMWSRIGTPLPFPEYQKPDGQPYLSGTEWEFLDAERASREHPHGLPLIAIYRRTEQVFTHLDDPDFDDKRKQYALVKTFFERFRDNSGSIRGGINFYETPDDFRGKFQNDLRELVEKLLSVPEASTPLPILTKPSIERIWPPDVSPFPGLRAFTPDDAPIFFGRGRETDALIKRIADERFVAVVGASGSGKSSLVNAGLIPRLKDNALYGSKDWLIVRFSPGKTGDNPFRTLYGGLIQALPSLRPDPFEASQVKERFVSEVEADPQALLDTCEVALAGRPEWVKLLFFIDQFEELFTVVHPRYHSTFIALLSAIVKVPRIRTVVTLRSDFFPRCVDWGELTELLRTGTFPLSAPSQIALYEMIKYPAERAALGFEADLPECILQDTGDEPGALALVAYTLDELYHNRDEDGRLTLSAYKRLGGVQGAIGKRAEETFGKLEELDQRMLPVVFRELVEVDERGVATRHRAPLEGFVNEETTRRLIEALIRSRLLTTYPEQSVAMVEVAHEALFTSWPRLATWIEGVQDDLVLLRQVKNASMSWYDHGQKAAFLWPDERLQPVYRMVEQLQPKLDNTVREFIRPESERLLEEMATSTTDHHRRSVIGERLSFIGDPRPGVGLRPDGKPYIEWCEVLSGTVCIEGRTFTVARFFVARYPVTYAQFQTFLDAKDGFENDAWWDGLARQPMSEQRTRSANNPRDRIGWFSAVAFARWLNACLPKDGRPPLDDSVIRLPTEWEWQHAAAGTDENQDFPWGDWDATRSNTLESGLSRAIAAGMYPHGSSACGALDLAGNVWEWCLNTYESLTTEVGGEERRSLRGGSYDFRYYRARSAARHNSSPFNDNDDFGFRLIFAAVL